MIVSMSFNISDSTPLLYHMYYVLKKAELFSAGTMKKEAVPSLHIPSFLHNEVPKNTDVVIILGEEKLGKRCGFFSFMVRL